MRKYFCFIFEIFEGSATILVNRFFIIIDCCRLHHKLVFENQEHQAKDASVSDADTFEIFDPRNPINKRRREESKKRQGEKKRK